VDNAVLNLVLSIAGVAVPLATAVYQFGFDGRKRLGWRVQLDTPFSPTADGNHSPVHHLLAVAGWHRGQQNSHRQSLVLLRVENNGLTQIKQEDYGEPEGKDKPDVGLVVDFPGRGVISVADSQIGGKGDSETLRNGLRDSIGFNRELGQIYLPKVPLARGQFYKVLAILEQAKDAQPDELIRPPVLRGEIAGRKPKGRTIFSRRPRVEETRSNTVPVQVLVALLAFLIAILVTQVLVTVRNPAPAGLADCATGHLTLAGSSAFAPVIESAGTAYHKDCPGANFEYRFAGSENGLDAVDAGGANSGMVAITDGPKPDGYPMLLPRPLALSLFTVIVNRDTGVRDLSAQQIRDLYAGKIVNWNQLHGNDVPVRLVNRNPGSGTRETFEQQVLGGPQAAYQPANCNTVAVAQPPSFAHCDVAVTDDMLNAVAGTPGAVGYSEYTDATKDSDVVPVLIDGHRPTREEAIHRAYPFWGTEFAYSYGELPPDSLAAGFIRYLTTQAGADIVRSVGDTPCDSLPNPVLCRPYE
jgi:phosphate transport system substrate-binding protein